MKLRLLPALVLIAIGLNARAVEPVTLSDRQELITLLFGGDVMLARGVTEAMRRYGPLYPWGNVLPLLQEADLALVNLECVITQSGNPFVPPRVFYFRADSLAAEALKLAGIDYVSLANNHAMDYRGEGLLETLDRLDQQGIAHAGAGANLAEARRPAFLRANAIRVGIVAFADHFREYAATATSPGINYLPISTDPQVLGLVKETLQAARHNGAHLVIFSIHWGPNMNPAPFPQFIEFAHAVIDAGADIFHGHSAHLFQGIEFYHGKLILYDTGDLVDDYSVHPMHRNDRQLLFKVTISPKRIEEVELIPVFISNAQVNRAKGDELEAILQRIRELSAKFGTVINRKGEVFVARAEEDSLVGPSG